MHRRHLAVLHQVYQTLEQLKPQVEQIYQACRRQNARHQADWLEQVHDFLSLSAKTLQTFLTFHKQPPKKRAKALFQQFYDPERERSCQARFPVVRDDLCLLWNNLSFALKNLKSAKMNWHSRQAFNTAYRKILHAACRLHLPQTKDEEELFCEDYRTTDIADAIEAFCLAYNALLSVQLKRSKDKTMERHLHNALDTLYAFLSALNRRLYRPSEYNLAQTLDTNDDEDTEQTTSVPVFDLTPYL